MFVVRPIKIEDQRDFEKFAFTASLGITNLPKNPPILHEKILNSINSFNQQERDPYRQAYIFVLEELESHQVRGTSTIKVKTGKPDPDYYFRLETIPNPNPFKEIPLPSVHKILTTIAYHEGPSEICALYLSPEYRKGGLGKLLSLSRLLFIAIQPQAFDQEIFAEMRGIILDNCRSPFWDAVGSHFLKLPFEKVQEIASHSKAFVPFFLPKHPIYSALLSEEAQNAINHPHVNTTPAIKILLQEGFYLTNEIDIFDGGPKVMAKTSTIETIKRSQQAEIGKIIPSDDCTTFSDCMISNERFDSTFRACYGKLKEDNGQVIISTSVADVLELKKGQLLRYVRQM